MKKSVDILKYGRIKVYDEDDRTFKFNSIDLETVNNELFLFGYTEKGAYKYVESEFYTHFLNFLITCAREKTDILTWSRYDNTHLIKLILNQIDDKKIINHILLRIGKINPIHQFYFDGYQITIENIIKDSIIFTLKDDYNNSRRVTIYNLKNLFVTDLETTAKMYGIDFYDKIGEEYHLIDEKRYNNDFEYNRLVKKSNKLDNLVLLEIVKKFLNDFKNETGFFPKTIFTAGSIARSYILTKHEEINLTALNFRALYRTNPNYSKLLDFSMKAYHGGKIESYVLGYIEKAKTIDITSAYPANMKDLPEMTNNIKVVGGDFFTKKMIDKYYYAFLRCDILITERDLIHPLIIKSPINKANLSPYGYIKNVTITKPEYDYLMHWGIDIKIHEAVFIDHVENSYPYRDLVNELFNNRMKSRQEENYTLENLYKTVINSLYGITYELTDLHEEADDSINWLGYRAGDFFNPITASYITALTRIQLSTVSMNILENGGQLYLSMTDSIIYDGKITLDIFDDGKKALGTFEKPEEINDIIILGAGRYEYKNILNGKYTIKNRGFSIRKREKSFYKDFDINKTFTIDSKTFVSFFRATTNKFNFDDLGHLKDDVYTINPFNLGGKRYIKNEDSEINLNYNHVKTYPVYLDKYLKGHLY